MPISLPDFIARWQAATLSERSAAQSHFNDLCDLLGQPKPAEAASTSASASTPKRQQDPNR
jgi:hypothetical protein